MRQTSEPYWWSLFAAGGVLAALFVPALAVATGFVLPTVEEAAAAARYEQLATLLSGGWWAPIVRLGLFLVIALGFFHCAHRIRHTLADLGLRPWAGTLSAACYGGAIAGTAAAAGVIVAM